MKLEQTQLEYDPIDDRNARSDLLGECFRELFL